MCHMYTFVTRSSFRVMTCFLGRAGVGRTIDCVPTTHLLHTVIAKIQGDGRKFLDRFKSYLGSQILSQSLNEVHIYRLQLKSATKGEFFSIYFCL